MVMVICGDDGRPKRRGKKIKTSLNDLIVIVISIIIFIKHFLLCHNEGTFDRKARHDKRVIASKTISLIVSTDA